MNLELVESMIISSMFHAQWMPFTFQDMFYISNGTSELSPIKITYLNEGNYMRSAVENIYKSIQLWSRINI